MGPTTLSVWLLRLLLDLRIETEFTKQFQFRQDIAFNIREKEAREKSPGQTSKIPLTRLIEEGTGGICFACVQAHVAESYIRPLKTQWYHPVCEHSAGLKAQSSNSFRH